MMVMAAPQSINAPSSSMHSSTSTTNTVPETPLFTRASVSSVGISSARIPEVNTLARLIIKHSGAALMQHFFKSGTISSTRMVL